MNRPLELGMEIRPVSRKDAVLETLRRAITEGELVPGQRLDPASIAIQLRCSRMPVRDAIKELEAEGAGRVLPLARNRSVAAGAHRH